MLRNALRSLTLQETNDEFSYEIVVIDNGSTKPTSAVVAEIAASSLVAVSYVREEAKGLAQALNRGVREARGVWLAFFDDDELAEPSWLKELLSAASVTKAQFVGGSRRLQLPSGGTLVLGLTCRGLLGEYVNDGTARVCQGKRIPSGGNLLIAREVFNAIGLFDTSMVMAGEDSDFVKRARASGIIVSISPTAIVHHVIPPYRVTISYFRWTSMRWGYSLANIDCKNSGRAKMFSCFVARIGQAIFVNLPLLIFSVFTRNATQSLDRECLLWRAVGYACGTVSLAAPCLFKQARFFSRLELRKERTSFS
jgi:glycosyltransferase involved in cell wall biosynthesis